MTELDAGMTAWLSERLKPIDFGGFAAPVAGETRTLSDVRDVLRPSRMGNCERRLTLEVRGLPFEEAWSVEGLMAVNFGTHAHQKIQAALPMMRHEISVDGPFLRGTLDTATPKGTVLDWKTINQRGYRAVKKAGMPQAGHWHQATWYSRHYGATRAAVAYLEKPPGEPALTGEILVFSGEVDHTAPHPYDLKAERILEHADRGTLPAYEETRACDWCPVKIACWRARPSEELRGFGSKINGTTFRPEETQKALAALTEGQELRLIHEPDNQYDLDAGRVLPGTKVAVAVKVMWGALHLGYLPAEGAAPVVADHLLAGGAAKAEVSEVTGGTAEKPNRGVNLSVWLS